MSNKLPFVKLLLLGVLVFAFQISFSQKAALPTGLELNYNFDVEKIERYESNQKLERDKDFPTSLYAVSFPVAPATPIKMAEEYINNNLEILGLKENWQESLKHHATRSSNAGHVVRYRQTYLNLPVRQTELTISISPSSKVEFVQNSYERNIEIKEVNANFDQNEAKEIARNYLGTQSTSRFETAELLIYPDAKGAILAYEVTNMAHGQLGEWHVYIDAKTKEIFKAQDEALYYCNHGKGHKHSHECTGHGNPIKEAKKNKTSMVATGTGFIFDPDPLSSAMVSYGGGYVDNNDVASADLNNARVSVTLNDIELSGGVYKLSGPWAEISDHDTPTKGLFTQTSSTFNFDRQQDGFEAVNVYYHIDDMMRYINLTLNCPVQPYQYPGGVLYDPSGAGGADQSFYSSGSGEVTFGEGCVDDGEDSDVIHHELGHGLHDWLTVGGLSNTQGLSEGFGDYVAQSYNRSLGNWGPADPQYNWVFNWDGHNECWAGRVTNSTAAYPGGLTGSIHTDGQIWSTCLMQTYDQIGRLQMDKAVFEGLAMTNGSANQNDAAVAVFQAAINLGYSQAELDVIYNNFTSTGYTLPVVAPPVANFSPTAGSNVNVCPGDGLNFVDLSSNTPTGWMWTFSGSANPTPTTSTAQNPVVTPTNNGTIIATLTSSNTFGSDSYSATVNVSIYSGCTNSCMSFTSTDTPISISANGSGIAYTSVINATGLSGTITDVNITNINITHSYAGDLDVTLTSPSGTIINIFNDECGSNGDGVDIGFDDAGGANLPCGMIGGGSFVPSQPLSTLNGENANGNWTLTVVDDANADGGTWNSWEIEICAFQPVTGNCSITAAPVVVSCFNNNTIPTADDFFTFTIEPSGTGTSGTYSISGGATATGLAYGAPALVDNGGSGFLISGGNLNIVVTDDADGSCTFPVTVLSSICNPTSPCTGPLTLTGTESGTIDNEADWIESDQVILSGAQVDYDAVQYVLMKSGFSVDAGALFEAFIDGCNNGGGGVN